MIKISEHFLPQDEETKVQFTVLTDRSQGGASIHDGEVELMVMSLLFCLDSIQASRMF